VNGYRLIIGLGNPGADYAETRHNAGFWLLDALASRLAAPGFASESKFFGLTTKVSLEGRPLHLLKPTTFMNRSGQSALALAQFYKVEPEEILAVHDELDIEPGQIRLKRGGGHGGHNGLRDLHRVFGPDYARIRVGIGHPGHKDRVLGYVLGKPQADERQLIDDAIDDTLSYFTDIVIGDWDRAMGTLHQR
jgi:peptidyl-tRNA hydrolase, PTH1 family